MWRACGTRRRIVLTAGDQVRLWNFDTRLPPFLFRPQRSCEPTPVRIVCCPSLARRSAVAHGVLARHAGRWNRHQLACHPACPGGGQPGCTVLAGSGNPLRTAAVQHLSGCCCRAGKAPKRCSQDPGHGLAGSDDRRVALRSSPASRRPMGTLPATPGPRTASAPTAQLAMCAERHMATCARPGKVQRAPSEARQTGRGTQPAPRWAPW